MTRSYKRSYRRFLSQAYFRTTDFSIYEGIPRTLIRTCVGYELQSQFGPSAATTIVRRITGNQVPLREFIQLSSCDCVVYLCVSNCGECPGTSTPALILDWVYDSPCAPINLSGGWLIRWNHSCSTKSRIQAVYWGANRTNREAAIGGAIHGVTLINVEAVCARKTYASHIFTSYTV